MLDAYRQSTPEVILGLVLLAVVMNLVAETWLLRRDLKLYQVLPPRTRKKSADAIARLPGLYLALFLWYLLLLGIILSIDNVVDSKISDQAELLFIFLAAGLLVLPLPLILVPENRLQRISLELAPRIQSLLSVVDDRAVGHPLEGRIERALLGTILASYFLFVVISLGSVWMGLVFAMPLVTGRARFRKKQLAMLTA